MHSTARVAGVSFDSLAKLLAEAGKACEAFHVRAPATQLCPSHAEARERIEFKAAALDAPVAWLDRAPPSGALDQASGVTSSRSTA
jgi:hypothetical protein